MYHWITGVFVFFVWKLNPAVAQNESIDVNLLFFYELDSTKLLFDAAVQYVNDNQEHSGFVRVNEIYAIKSVTKNQEATALITDLCKRIDAAYASANKPDFALDFTRRGINSEAVKVILKTLKIPTISGSFGQAGDIREWRNLTEQQQGYLIQIPPPADLVVQSVRSIVDMQKITTAAILFDKEYEMYHKYKSLLQDMPTRHLLMEIEPLGKKNLRSQLDRLAQVDIVNFFIAASAAETSRVLAEASGPQGKTGSYFGEKYAWYSMSLREDSHPECSACKGNVTVVHLSPKMDPKKGKLRRDFTKEVEGFNTTCLTDLFYFDLAVDGIRAIGKIKGDNVKLTLIKPLTCAKYELSAANSTDELEVNLYDALELAAKENMMDFNFDSKENGKNYPQFQMQIEQLKFFQADAKPWGKGIGEWQSGFEGSKSISYNQGSSLQQHLAHNVYRIVTVIQPPFIYLKKGCKANGRGQYDHCYEGLCIDMLNYIRKELNFNYTIRHVEKYGYMKADYPHEWTGMMKELKDGTADIALGALSLMPERESVVDFTIPYYDLVGISIVMRKIRTPTSLFKFLTVLENDVWMCILGAFFFTSILMWIFDRWSPYSYQNNREKFEDDEEKREFNLKECLWFCMTSLTPQGGGEAPKNLSGRLVAATWWLFGFIIIASYTANLAAFLTVSRLDAPIESLEDLSKQYKIQYAPHFNGSAYEYFDRMAHIEHRFYEIWKDMSLNDSLDEYQRSQLAVWEYPVSDRFTKMWQAMMENLPTATFQEGIARVLKGSENKEEGFAFLGEATDLRYEVLISCDLKMIGEEFSRMPYAVAVQKGSPLKEPLNAAIAKLLRERRLEKLKLKWWDNNKYKATDCPRDDNMSDGISIYNIGGVFIVILVGMGMTCFTLVIEYWWYRRRRFANRLIEMTLPPAKEYGGTAVFNPEKNDYNTQYDRPTNTDLPTVENSW